MPVLCVGECSARSKWDRECEQWQGETTSINLSKGGRLSVNTNLHLWQDSVCKKEIMVEMGWRRVVALFEVAEIPELDEFQLYRESYTWWDPGSRLGYINRSEIYFSSDTVDPNSPIGKPNMYSKNPFTE